METLFLLVLLPKGCRGKVPGVTAWEDNRQPAIIGPEETVKLPAFPII